MAAIPCVVVRGGTSKGVYINEADLPSDSAERDALICELFGSGESRQIDGIGGGDPLTSKVAILAAPSVDGAQVDYLSGEVRLRRSEVNYGIMCGNLAAGVGPAAVQLGLVDASRFPHKLKVNNRNSDSIIDIEYVESLLMGVGSPFNAKLIFNSPIGNNTGCLLPTGKRVSSTRIGTVDVEFSVVDAGAIYAFVRAKDLNLRGDECAIELDAMLDVRASLELFREHVAIQVNLHCKTLPPVHSGQIKIALLAPANEGEAHIQGRIINPAKTHKAYAVSGAIATCVAAHTQGTIVQALAKEAAPEGRFRISHPEGVLEVGLRWAEGDTPEHKHIRAAEICRTARVLMAGMAFSHPPADEEGVRPLLDAESQI